MRIAAKPSVMPCTCPNHRLTAVTPASMPLAAGSAEKSTGQGERYANSRIARMPSVAMRKEREASRSTVARAVTAARPGPASRSRAPAGAVSANAARRLASAWTCASRSNPGARVWASKSARLPSRENHTPSCIDGPSDLASRPARRRISPVGSGASHGRNSALKGEASSARDSCSAARKPSALKRSAFTPGLRM